jgi:hypothetical protein
LLFIVACCLLSAVGFLLIFSSARAGVPRVCFKDVCYAVEIARTPEAQERGLMGRDSLAPGQGMLFMFVAPNRYGFWMKNMKFPIDILWLDGQGNIVHSVQSAPTCTAEPCPVYTPPSEALYVLEVPAGEAFLHKNILTDKANFEGLSR